MTTIFAKNYRGFKEISLPLEKTIFLVGDNSTGKSSLMYLANYVINSELDSNPSLKSDSLADRYDFFSPYFDNADVTIGFMKNTQENNIAKLITIKKGSDFDSPLVLRFSIIKNKTLFTIKRKGIDIYVRIKKLRETFSDTSSIYKLHDDNKKFIRCPLSATNSSINDIKTIIRAIASLGEDKGKNLFEESTNFLFENYLGKFRLISPLRANPSSYYNYSDKIDTKGSHFAPLLYDIKNKSDSEKRNKALSLINSYGKDSGLFDEIDVEKMSKIIESPPLVVTIKRKDKIFSITQVGFGVSQSLPIIVDAAISCVYSDNVIFGLQQPELHLHPRAQASMGQFIFDCAKENLNMLVETHSDFIIDRFKSLQKHAEVKINSEILFIESSCNGNIINRIPINDDGETCEEPDSYRDFFVQEYLRTI